MTVFIPGEPIHLKADPHRLAQVASNLLNNAAKYTPEGGRISLTAERQGSDVVVSVKDTGIGTPADMLDLLFAIAQTDHPVERGHTGLGIGLTLVKSLVEMHGGSIEVRTKAQIGAASSVFGYRSSSAWRPRRRSRCSQNGSGEPRSGGVSALRRNDGPSD